MQYSEQDTEIKFVRMSQCTGFSLECSIGRKIHARFCNIRRTDPIPPRNSNVIDPVNHEKMFNLSGECLDFVFCFQQ